jgi:hypothetical protein
MNVQRMEELRDFLGTLIGKPDTMRMDMGDWAQAHDGDDWTEPDEVVPHDNHCQTSACIAGWAIVLFTPAETAWDIFRNDDPEEVAARLLDIDRRAWGGGLFLHSCWPAELYNEYAAAHQKGDNDGRLRAAMKAIDWRINQEEGHNAG